MTLSGIWRWLKGDDNGSDKNHVKVDMKAAKHAFDDAINNHNHAVMETENAAIKSRQSSSKVIESAQQAIDILNRLEEGLKSDHH